MEQNVIVNHNTLVYKLEKKPFSIGGQLSKIVSIRDYLMDKAVSNGWDILFVDMDGTVAMRVKNHEILSKVFPIMKKPIQSKFNKGQVYYLKDFGWKPNETYDCAYYEGELVFQGSGGNEDGLD